MFKLTFSESDLINDYLLLCVCVYICISYRFLNKNKLSHFIIESLITLSFLTCTTCTFIFNEWGCAQNLGGIVYYEIHSVEYSAYKMLTFILFKLLKQCYFYLLTYFLLLTPMIKPGSVFLIVRTAVFIELSNIID